MLAKKMRDIVSGYVDKHLFSGVIRIKRGNDIIYESATGYASKPYLIPNQLSDRFSTGSVTKMYTAYGILKLVDKGVFNLLDSASDYVTLGADLLPSHITIKDLLTHTSGIGEYYDDTQPDGYEQLWQHVPSHKITSIESAIPLIGDEPTMPYGEFSYNSAGYIVLGYIIESVTGRSYYEYMREEVFKANYLYETDFVRLDDVEQRIARGYIPVRDAKQNLVGWRDNIFSVPARGLPDMGAYTSARDAIKFLKLIKEGDHLSVNIQEQWLKKQIKVDDDLFYGLGLWIMADEQGDVYKYGHAGEAPGVSARLFTYPKANVDLVMLSNHGLSTKTLIEALEKEFL